MKKRKVFRAWALSFDGKLNIQPSFVDIYGSYRKAKDTVEEYDLSIPTEIKVVEVEIRQVTPKPRKRRK